MNVRDKIFSDAIDIVLDDIECLRARIAECEALVEQLRARAGIEPPAPAASPASRAAPRRRKPRPKPGRDLVPVEPVEPEPETDVEEPAETFVPGDGAAKVAAIATEIAAATKALTAATKTADATAIAAAIDNLMRAERRGGKLLESLAGSVRGLPFSKSQRMALKRLSALTIAKFEIKIKQRVASSVRPGVSAWHTDEQGNLTRVVTAPEAPPAAPGRPSGWRAPRRPTASPAPEAAS